MLNTPKQWLVSYDTIANGENRPSSVEVTGIDVIEALDVAVRNKISAGSINSITRVS